MKIGILELGDHYEYVYSLCKIFDTPTNQVYVISDKRVVHHLKEWLGVDHEKFFWLTKDDDEGHLNFFNKLTTFIDHKGLEVLVICTIPSHYVYYWAFLKQIHIFAILTLHNLNTWLKPKLSYRLTDLYNYIMVKLILNQVSSVAVLEQNLRNYIKENNLLNKPIFIFPYELWEGFFSKQPARLTQTINFVIPGTVQQKRKDFNLVLDAFQYVAERNHNIALTLLGSGRGSYAQDIFNRCIFLQKQGYNINFYKEFVSVSEFQKVMQESDCIIAPIQLVFAIGCNQEYYGITKSSGSVFDMIRYGKPGIFPEKFQANCDMETCTMKYRDKQHLCELLLQLVNSKDELNRLQDNAVKNAAGCTVEKFRPQFAELKKLL